MGNRFNNNVAGESCRRNCKGNVAGESGRNRCNRNVLADRIALRGPGCISGTGRCGDFTASFVESECGFAQGYGDVEGSFVCCGQVSPAGNVQNQEFRRSRRNNDNDCCDCLRTPTIVPR